MELPYLDPYRIKMVEKIEQSTAAQRKKWIEEVDFNLVFLNSAQIMIDMLTDSGSGGFSDKQWGAMMTADESYAGSLSFEKLKKTVSKLTGFQQTIPAHQGRASENVLMSALIEEQAIIPGNKAFFTTESHIQKHGGTTVDCTIDEAQNIQSDFPFKGNVNIEKLEDNYKKYGKKRIPFCLLTITCNSVGGQAVSLDNIKAVKKLSQKYGIPVFFDAARFAQNAYFIKTREEKYNKFTIKEIVKEIFKNTEGMFMSAKKDGLVNMGGFVAVNNEKLYDKILEYTILYEGYITYGGMSGMNMSALAQGLEEVTDFEFLQSRIYQIEYLENKLDDYRIPFLKPSAGHAIFLDALQILPQIPRNEHPSHTLAVEIYKEGGIRAGNGVLFTELKDEITGEISYPENELLRLTIPQREYTQNHLDYVAAVLKNIYDKRKEITRGYLIKYEPQAGIAKPFMAKFKEA